MKKWYGLVLFMLVALSLSGFTAEAERAWLGDFYLYDYIGPWSNKVPEISLSIKPIQYVGNPELACISVRLPYGIPAAHVYVFIENGILLHRELITCGGKTYRVTIPSTYNNRQWKVGTNEIVAVIVPSPFVFKYPEARITLQQTRMENFTGYPVAGYVIIKKAIFEVCQFPPICCCCQLRCP